jgi:hypothetical protein
MFELNPVNFSLLVTFGFFIGILGSVMGVGGGIFLVPALVLALGIPIHQAIAVSLVAIVATSSAVASVNVERGLANMRLGVTLEVTTALGSIIGALVSGLLAPNIVRFLFSITLFPVAVGMFIKGRRGLKRAPRPLAPASTDKERGGSVGAFDSEFFDPSIDSHTSYRVKNIVPASIISFFAGGLSGLLGLGGGIIQVPVMNLMCGMPIKAAAATSNFLIGVSAAASAFIYFRNGYLIPDLAAVVVSGVLLGSFAGTYILYKARSEKIQIAFSVLVFIVAVKMLTGVL